MRTACDGPTAGTVTLGWTNAIRAVGGAKLAASWGAAVAGSGCGGGGGPGHRSARAGSGPSPSGLRGALELPLSKLDQVP